MSDLYIVRGELADGSVAVQTVEVLGRGRTAGAAFVVEAAADILDAQPVRQQVAYLSSAGEATRDDVTREAERLAPPRLEVESGERRER